MIHPKTLIEELAQADLARSEAYAVVAAMFERIRGGGTDPAAIGADCEAIRQGAAAVARNVASRMRVAGHSPPAPNSKLVESGSGGCHCWSCEVTNA